MVPPATTAMTSLVEVYPVIHDLFAFIKQLVSIAGLTAALAAAYTPQPTNLARAVEGVIISALEAEIIEVKAILDELPLTDRPERARLTSAVGEMSQELRDMRRSLAQSG